MAIKAFLASGSAVLLLSEYTNFKGSRFESVDGERSVDTALNSHDACLAGCRESFTLFVPAKWSLGMPRRLAYSLCS